MLSFRHFYSTILSSSLLVGAEIIIGQDKLNVVHNAALHQAAKVFEFTALQVINYYKLMFLKTAGTPVVVNYLVSMRRIRGTLASLWPMFSSRVVHLEVFIFLFSVAFMSIQAD